MKELNLPLRLILIVLFGAAMAFIEAAVVVYLRELYYPEGFAFPLQLIPPRLIIIEIARETATIIMLAVVGFIWGKKHWERFGWFIIAFGVWDIFYYIWLKVTLNWPGSLLDWDILFLIPLPWIGPVIAPIAISLLMIITGLAIVRLYNRRGSFAPPLLSWILAVAATLIIFYSFMLDTDATLRQQIPQPYYFSLLVIGLILYVFAFVIAYRRSYGKS